MESSDERERRRAAFARMIARERAQDRRRFQAVVVAWLMAAAWIAYTTSLLL